MNNVQEVATNKTLKITQASSCEENLILECYAKI